VAVFYFVCVFIDYLESAVINYCSH